MSDAHLHVSEQLHDRVRAHCKPRGVALSDFTAAALESYLASPVKKRLPVLERGPLVPDPFTAPPFWARPDYSKP